MDEPADVPPETIARLRVICLALPEAYEEPAWVGIRWRIRTRTFAHVLAIDSGRPPAYARAAATAGPAVVVTFRSSGPELDALGHAGHPFFRPEWGPDVVGMVLDADVDWAEVTELVTESYFVLAPRKLAPRTPRVPLDEVAGRPAEDVAKLYRAEGFRVQVVDLDRNPVVTLEFAPDRIRLAVRHGNVIRATQG